MNALWEGLAKRIDALNARERMFLFLSILVSLLALADALWLTPAQKAQQLQAQQFTAQAAELDRLRVELAVHGQAKNSNQEVRDQIGQAQQSLDELNQEIAKYVPNAQGGPALEQVLVTFLRRQDGLVLLSTGTLKEDVAPTSAPAASAASTPASGAPATATLQRRGLELRVAGSYAELTRYVKTLEVALPNLRWGPMQLQVNKQTPELTLRVYVLGVRS